MDTRLDYLQYFYDCVDFVSSGRRGAICDDRDLILKYRPSYYDILQKQLSNPDPRVRIEIIKLLTALRERQALDDVRRLRMKDNENVASACLGYLAVLDEDDTVIPQLLDVMKHRDGNEFIAAARRMRSVGRPEDIPELRRIYGQVDREMADAVSKTISSIADRNEELIPKKRLLLSKPIFPDEKRFMSFVDSSTVYMDIRYRDSISERTRIKADTYNNIAEALRKIQTRLYNEKENLKYYSDEAREGYAQVEDLFLWVSDDLLSKEVDMSGSSAGLLYCPMCGNTMMRGKNGWTCPVCGSKN